MAALFSDVFHMKETLGEGAYGLVKRCVEKNTGFEFAVKMIMKRKTTERQLKDLENEARICCKLKSRNVVRLRYIFEEDYCHYFVFDLVKGGELFHDIVHRDVYSEADASCCMNQILEAINHCHQNDVIHRDLKPQNLLLESKRRGAAIKLADFGFSIEVTGDKQDTYGWCGTPGYMAPEILMRKPYGKLVDIWACGVICAEWDSVSSAAKDLIRQMLTVDTQERITAADALKNQWICQRENVAVIHRQETVDCLKKFNARQKIQAAARVVMVAKLNSKRLKQISKKDGSQNKVLSNSSNTVGESLSIENGSKSLDDSKSLKDSKPILSIDPNNTATVIAKSLFANSPQSSSINSTRSVNSSQVAQSSNTVEKSCIQNDSKPLRDSKPILSTDSNNIIGEKSSDINSSRSSTINSSRSVNNSDVAVSTRSSNGEEDNDNSNRRQEIIRITKKLIEAINIADFETYAQLCDPHITAFQTETLTNLTDGTNFQKFWFENVLTANEKYKAMNTTIRNPFVHLLGDEAACIAYVRLTQYTDKYGRACTHQSKETRVWHKRDGKWQNVHLHRSVIRHK